MTQQRPTPIPARATLLVLSFVPLFLGLGFLQIYISAWLLATGFTAAEIGTLIAAQGVAAIGTAVPLGIVSDVYGRKHLLTAGALAGAAGLLAFAFTSQFLALVAISVALGFTEGASVTTWNALLADMTDETNRNRVFSLSFVMINVTTGVGLVLPGGFPYLESLLGVSAQSIHTGTLLILGAVSFVTPAGIYLLLRGHEEAHNPGRKWSGLSNKGTMLKMGFVGSTIGFGAGFIIPLIATWFSLRFGVGDELSGPILAFSNILIGFSAVASPRLASKFGQLRAIMLTTGSSMLFMLTMAFVPLFAAAAAVYVVRSALMNMAGPLLDSFSMSIFPAEQRGLASAVSNIMFRLPNSVSSIFGGVIIGLSLLELPFFVASAFYIVGLMAFYMFFVAGGRYSQVMDDRRDE